MLFQVLELFSLSKVHLSIDHINNVIADIVSPEYCYKVTHFDFKFICFSALGWWWLDGVHYLLGKMVIL